MPTVCGSICAKSGEYANPLEAKSHLQVDFGSQTRRDRSPGKRFYPLVFAKILIVPSKKGEPRKRLGWNNSSMMLTVLAFIPRVAFIFNGEGKKKRYKKSRELTRTSGEP